MMLVVPCVCCAVLCCLSVCLSVCLFVCLSVCMPVCLSACLPACLSCLSCLSVCCAACLPAYHYSLCLLYPCRPSYWFLLALVPLMCMLIDITATCFSSIRSPSPNLVLREMEHLTSTKYVIEAEKAGTPTSASKASPQGVYWLVGLCVVALLALFDCWRSLYWSIVDGGCGCRYC